jgi:O-antigen chain-terminating methyltransferase
VRERETLSFSVDSDKLRNQSLRVSLRVNYLWKPCDVFDAADGRELGIALRKIGFTLNGESGGMPSIDIEQIMAEIRADIARKGYRDDVPPFDEFIRRSDKNADVQDQENLDVRSLEQVIDRAKATYAINPYHPVRSRFGAIVVFFKKIIRRMIHFHTTPIVLDQNTYNDAVLQSLIQLCEQVKATLDQLTNLDQQFKSRQIDIERQFESLRADIENRLESQQIDTERQFESQQTDMERQLESQRADIERRLESQQTNIEHQIESLHGDIERRLESQQADIGRQLESQRDATVRQCEKTELTAFRYLTSLRSETESKTTDDFVKSGQINIPVIDFNNVAIDGIDYFDFENRFRGTRALIKERQELYIPMLKGKKNIIDLGCGRGEFLELLAEHHISARGVDISQEFVNWCNFKALSAEHGDAIDYVLSLPDESIDGITGMQIAEHLTFDRLMFLCHAAYAKLTEGGVLILETPNPACLTVYASAFYIDPTHNKPIHFELLRYIVEKSGFKNVKVVFTEGSKVNLSIPLIDSDTIRNLAEINDAITDLNQLLYGSQDYAVIAIK